MPPIRRLLLVALTTTLVAGCFGDDPVASERTVAASGGKVSPGWAYDGVGVSPASASLSGRVNDPDDTGSFSVTFDHAGSSWAVAFDQMAGSQPFMDGGVEFNLVEHGDSGTADASIPRIFARIAAWGTATVTRDGEPVVGKAGDRWAAHLMVSDDTVRGADGRILNAAGTAPYSPGAPGDATIVGGDAQAFLKLVHPDGETATRAPVNESRALTFQGPESTQTVEVPSEAGARAVTINYTASGGQAPAGIGQGTITVKDANGNATKTEPFTYTPNAPPSGSIALASQEITGPFTVEVKGTGAFTMTLDVTVAYDDHPFLVLTWDEVATTDV